MSNIMLDNGKSKFDITKWENLFEEKGLSIPKTEVEFRDIMKGKIFSIRYIEDAIKEITQWDDEMMDEECPEKAQKVDKFFELYDVIYPASEKAVPLNENVGRSTSVVSSDAEPMTLEEAQVFLDENRIGLIKDVDGNIRVGAPSVFYENMSVTVNSNFRIKYSPENLSRNNVFIIDDTLKKVIAAGRIAHTEKGDLIIIDKGSIIFAEFNNKTKFNIALPEVDRDRLTGKIFYKEITMHVQKMKETDHVLCIDFGTSNTTAGSYRLKIEDGSEPELVSFANVTQENRLVNYFPTVVYVENCEDKNNIIYKFGFEAKKT